MILVWLELFVNASVVVCSQAGGWAACPGCALFGRLLDLRTTLSREDAVRNRRVALGMDGI